MRILRQYHKVQFMLPNTHCLYLLEVKKIKNKKRNSYTIREEEKEERIEIQKYSSNLKRFASADADAASIDGLKGNNGNMQPFNSLMEGTTEGPDKENCSTSKELAVKSVSFAVNGLPTSGSSLSPGQDREQNSRPSNENQNPVASGHDEVPPSIPTGEVCEFLSETSVDVPVMCDNDNTATDSKNSSSMPNEGLSQDLTRPNSKRRKTTGAAEKQQGKKLSRYSRRGRGRVK